MLKKMMLLAYSVACFAGEAGATPFGMFVQKGMNTPQVRYSNPTKKLHFQKDNVKTEQFIKIALPTQNFIINGVRPTEMYGYQDGNGQLAGVIAFFNSAQISSRLEDMTTQYKITFNLQDSYGGSIVEYTDGNVAIRIINNVFGSTTILYGTPNWLNAYDKSQGRESDIQQARAKYAQQQQAAPLYKSNGSIKGAADAANGNIQSKMGLLRNLCQTACQNRAHTKQTTKQLQTAKAKVRTAQALSSPASNKYSIFSTKVSDLKAKMADRKQALATAKPPKQDQKTYVSSSRYVKNGDIEEWLSNDNGKITVIKKTPQGTTVSHDIKNSSINVPRREIMDINREFDVFSREWSRMMDHMFRW